MSEVKVAKMKASRREEPARVPAKMKATRRIAPSRMPVAEAASRFHASAESTEAAALTKRAEPAVRALRGEKVTEATDVQRLVDSFTAREFPKFVAWMQKKWDQNDAAVLSPNPPNHTYDADERSIDLAVGKRNTDRRIAHQKKITPAHILKRGEFRRVLQSLSRLPSDQQLEGAMAFLVRHKDGDLIDNAPEFRQFEKTLEQQRDSASTRLPEGIDNPFYKGVCEAIVTLFREHGWLPRSSSRRK